MKGWCFLPLIVSLALLAGLPSAALSAAEGEAMSADELDDRFRERRREAAASFRVQAREMAESVDAEYQAAAAQAHAEALDLFRDHQFRSARRRAERAYRNYPYAHSAPRLLHLLVRMHAATGRPTLARRHLVDLWERYPGYDGIDSAMSEALTGALVLREEGLQINLDAGHPRQVFQVNSVNKVTAVNDLFRFLAINGDRQSVAPIAQLSLARSLIAEGSRAKIFDARIAYDDFLLTYPRHPLVFEALIELSVSYLLTYRGPRFDVGILIDAAHVIDQAELYTGEDSQRVEMVRHYRAQIRGWHQERDFYAAEWYRDHRQWEASRYYYQWVVRRDATTDLGQQSQAALQELPSDTVREPRMGIVDWIRK